MDGEKERVFWDKGEEEHDEGAKKEIKSVSEKKGKKKETLHIWAK